MNELTQGQTETGDGEDTNTLAKRIIFRRGEFEAEIKNLPSSIVEALYHEITGNRETLNFFIPDPKLIEYSHINDLVVRIHQNTEKYYPTAKSTKVEIRFSDGRKYSFSSWLKFSAFDFRTKARTQTLSIIYDFVINSKVGTFNAYKITITLQSVLVAGELFTDSYRDMIFDNVSSSAMRVFEIDIEYIDSLVARDYYDIIREWHKNLPDVADHKWVKRVGGAVFGNLLFHTISVASLFPIYFAYVYSARLNYDIKYLSFNLILAISIMITSVSFGRYFLFLCLRYLNRVRNVSILKLTDGDIDSINQHKSRNIRKITTSIFWAIGLISSIALNVFSSYIYDAMK